MPIFTSGKATIMNQYKILTKTRLVTYFIFAILVPLIYVSCTEKDETSSGIEFELMELGFDYHYVTLADFHNNSDGLPFPENLGMDFRVLNTNDTTAIFFLSSAQDEGGLSIELKSDTVIIPLLVYTHKLELPPNEFIPLRAYVNFSNYNDMFDIYFKNKHDTANTNLVIQLRPETTNGECLYKFSIKGDLNARLYFEDTVVLDDYLLSNKLKNVSKKGN